MDVANDLSVPIELRSHEREQLNEYLPEAEESYFMGERYEERDDVAVLIEQLSDSSGKHVSFTVEQWRTCVSALSRVDDGLRPWWLQKKVVNRLNERVEELQ